MTSRTSGSSTSPVKPFAVRRSVRRVFSMRTTSAVRVSLSLMACLRVSFSCCSSPMCSPARGAALLTHHDLRYRWRPEDETPMTIELADVRELHRFDVSALQAYLERRVPGFRGPITVRQFRGGQSNPTYYLTTGDGAYVLRRKPPGKLLPSAHAVDREYRVLTALQGTGVPVPRTYVLCEDPDVIGTSFYLMEHV